MAIIAGYAGIGKSYYSREIEGALEIPSMPYRWILPSCNCNTENELEKEKGAFYHLANPLFPMNYVLEILKAEANYPYVIIPTVESVLKILQEKYNRKCILVYPENELKESYRQRYIARGNSEDFMSLFVGEWDERLEKIRKNQGIHIPLSKDEYLSDVRMTIDKFACEKSEPLSSDHLKKIETELLLSKQNLALLYLGWQGTYGYRIQNIDDCDQKKFLYQVGRLAFERETRKALVLNVDKIILNDVIWIESETVFLNKIAQDE